jgi:hypothetical protein
VQAVVEAQQFDFKTVTFQVVLPNGSVEAGRGVGVTKDVIAGFWEEFYVQCTVGHTAKVPYIRHDLQEKQWEAVAKFLLYGWTEFGYLPISLAQPFLEVLFGVVLSDLTDSFLLFLSSHERELVTKALANFSSVEYDDTVDFLGDHDCRKIVSTENFKTLLQEIAHKELIQEPSFIVRCWQPMLSNISITISHVQLHLMYLDRMPSGKQLAKLFDFPDNMNAQQQSAADHLKRYVRNLDEKDAKAFLRFCTGFDIIMCSKIVVAFTSTCGLQRRPVAHTCSDLLELPSTYDNFVDLRAEFDNILHCGSGEQWLIDIV